MAATVYLLCGLTSVACALLLLRQHRRTRGGLLFWSTLCFTGLALANILLFTDLVMLPGVDLSGIRNSLMLVSLVLLLFGLIRETT
jgi:hypothetical protein